MLCILLHDAAAQVAKPKRAGSGVLAFPPATNESPIKLNASLEAWKGFFSTVRQTSKDLILNINSTWRLVFAPKVRLSDLMLKIKQSSGGVEPDWKRYLPGLEVIVTLHGLDRKKVVKHVGPGTARETRVEWQTRTLSVEEFYRTGE